MIRIAAFFLNPITGGLAAVVTLPAVTGAFGADGLLAVSVGTSIGLIGVILVDAGWSLVGPQLSLHTPVADRSRLIAECQVGSLAIGLVTLPIVGAVALLASKTYSTESAFIAGSTLLSGLTINWYFIGLGRPFRVLLVDSLPRLISGVTASFIIVEGGGLWSVPLCQAAGWVASAALSLRMANFQWHAVGCGLLRTSLARLRSHTTIIAGRLASAGYQNLPVIVVSGSMASDAASFAAVDRLQRLTLVALLSLPNATHSFLKSSDPNLLRRSLQTAVGLLCVAGLVAAIGFFFAYDQMQRLILSGTGSVSVIWVLLGSATIFAVSAARAFGAVGLVHLSQSRWVGSASIIVAILAVPAVVALTNIAGGLGAFIVVACAECAVAGIVATRFFIARRAPRVSSPDNEANHR